METELTAMQRDVAYLMDRTAIMDCIARHARGCDRHDVDLITAAYHSDGIDEHGNVTNLGARIRRLGQSHACGDLPGPHAQHHHSQL